MPRRLPSLNALRAFEAAARHGSFTKAALELHVTQGAVSHQVKALELDLGIELFRRAGQRLVLADAGKSYLEVVRDAFDRLSFGTENLLQRQSAGVLTVTVSPNFAAKWLVHRLGRFAEAHPGIDLRVSSSAHHVDFAREDIDLGIRHGDGQWPGLHVTRLCVEELFPVCSPKFMRGPRRLRAPADLKRHTLLHTDDRREWGRWLAEAGVTGVDPSRGPVFNQAHLAIDAAIGGQGVALARTALAVWDILAGRLVRPFALALKIPYGYWIVCPKTTAELPKIRVFRDWLLAEAAEELRRLRSTASATPGRGRARRG